jgi:hypothetical protein
MTLFRPVVGGDVALDVAAAGTWDTDEDTQSDMTITVAANANKALFACIQWTDAAAGTATVNGVSSSVDGAFTAVTGSELVATAGGAVDVGISWWVLVNPTAGAHTVTATMSAATDAKVVNLVSVYNVNQVTPYANVDTDDLGADPAIPADDVITTADGDMAISAMTYNNGTNAISITAGTSLWDSGVNVWWGENAVAGYVLADGVSETITYGGTSPDYAIVSGFAIQHS